MKKGLFLLSLLASLTMIETHAVLPGFEDDHKERQCTALKKKVKEAKDFYVSLLDRNLKEDAEKAKELYKALNEEYIQKCSPLRGLRDIQM
ncbi:MAG: hypothetical protein Q8S31_00845 [Alphaproteobacteria bacterium]|nr:hypothetical protein [Alphaproteobacteria bacterium]